VLERGRRWGSAPGATPFPRKISFAAPDLLWGKDRGLFDARAQSRMVTVQAAGYGGGSLIYANVHVEAPAEVFDNGWPAAYNLNALKPYYNLVAYMLNLAPITMAPGGPPTKSAQMEAAARQRNRQAQFFYPNLAVNFGQPRDAFQGTINAAKKCNFCGECFLGCSDGAKHTLDMNYLRIAEVEGAEIHTECEVTSIARTVDGNYKVDWTDWSGSERTSRSDIAKTVFVCAGAITSTELLLRCRDDERRDAGPSLPNLPPTLGRGYSGNGDFLAFAFDTERPVNPYHGPTITSSLICDVQSGPERHWFMFQDGGYPQNLGRLVQKLNPCVPNQLRRRLDQVSELAELVRAIVPGLSMPGLPRPAPRVSRSAPANREDNVAVFLAIGRDNADGTIRWNPDLTRAWIDWDIKTNLPLYGEEERMATDLATALGANEAFSPLWRYWHLPISVHNLGGCRMSEHEGDGVVDENGQVWGYPNLYVLDGSILPRSVGVNPSHTIAAIAERNVAVAIKEIKSLASPWQPPQYGPAQAAAQPDPIHAKLPGNPGPPARKPPVTVTFHERLTSPLGDADLVVTQVTTPPLDQLVLDPSLPCTLEGQFSIKLKPRRGLELNAINAKIENGRLQLFVPGDDFYIREMRYEFNFEGNDERGRTQTYKFRGRKVLQDRTAEPLNLSWLRTAVGNVWGPLTTLHYCILDSDNKPLSTDPQELRITIGGVLDQLMSLNVPERGQLDKLGQKARFAKMFVSNVIDLFVRDRAPTRLLSCKKPK
jgi:cholesterol oxidase